MLPLQVQGYSNNIATRGSDLKHNDFASLQLLFENGLIAEISAHGGCVHPHFHQLQVFGSEKSFTNTITGQGWLDGCERDTFIREAKGEYPEKMERGKALTSFLDAIVSGNNRPLVDQEAVFNSMSICLAAEQAIQTGREMTIEYI
jgi:predicted dehydrogenase